jgi:signal transduction histidine kinase
VATESRAKLTDPHRRVRRDVVLDLALAIAVFGASLVLLAARADSGAHAHAFDLTGALLVALASLPLAAWRWEPLAVFVFTAAASAALNGLGYPPGPPLGPTIALFLLGLQPERTRARRLVVGIAVGTLFLAHVAAVGLAEDEFPTVPLLFGALVWGGAWVLGDRLRQRRSRVAELEERAQRAERDAERERRLAVAEERTRIARDLHDSAAHAINVILVQAGAARLLQKNDPEGARAALSTIEDVARETIGEIDALVRGLRENGNGAGEAAVEPPIGLAALDTLVERYRAGGVGIELEYDGDARPLPRALDQAAYRIVQESLANVARHGGGRAHVVVRYGARELELTVSNPSARRVVHAGGHGILGMRERAALLGGSVEAGGDGRRFRVHARLPYVAVEEQV